MIIVYLPYYFENPNLTTTTTHFNPMLTLFGENSYQNGEPKGRKRDMSAVGCLGLVLMWYCTTGVCTRSSAMNFGQKSTPMYIWLKFGRRILLKSVINNDSEKVELPS